MHQEMQGMSRENALGEFIRHQLHPLGERGKLCRHMRIFNWEAQTHERRGGALHGACS